MFTIRLVASWHNLASSSRRRISSRPALDLPFFIVTARRHVVLLLSRTLEFPCFLFSHCCILLALVGLPHSSVMMMCWIPLENKHIAFDYELSAVPHLRRSCFSADTALRRTEAANHGANREWCAHLL